MSEIEIERLDGSVVLCDLEARTLAAGRYRVKFTPLEWAILTTLYEARPKIVSRNELLHTIWGNEHEWNTRTIDVHITSIRKKLAYIKGARIDSIYGQGYKLVMLNRF